MISSRRECGSQRVAEPQQGVDTSLEIHLAHLPTNPPHAPAAQQTQVKFWPPRHTDPHVRGTAGALTKDWDCESWARRGFAKIHVLSPNLPMQYITR